MDIRFLVAKLCRLGACCVLVAGASLAFAQTFDSSRPTMPPQAAHAQRFLNARGRPHAELSNNGPASRRIRTTPAATSPNAATWQPLGPTAVSTVAYGLVSGRVTSVAIDPNDAQGNHVYVGTTGGGVWVSSNAASADASTVRFKPVTDGIFAGLGVFDPSISIGAVSVQPDEAGIILAGTGDPNDALDSYYGAGILRSTDKGETWSLISTTADQKLTFAGEGFAGFAWSDSQHVVAAVSQAYEGVLTNALQSHASYMGLYYSKDAGASWTLATIADLSGSHVQGPTDSFVRPDGNAATSVVWNRLRGRFIAALRYHGYYESVDGINWTRLAAQPGNGLSAQMCPTNPGLPGSIDCPIFRGTLAVNPVTGDTFAWTVDSNDQDQGIWQNACGATQGVCSNQDFAFSKQWNSSPLQTYTPRGPATIANGDYTLALAAIPSGQDTLVFAGADDIWQCSLANLCAWRNTTNSSSCGSAQVAEYQHVLSWNAANPTQLFIGNDGGLWRSVDAVNESGSSACSPTDASHFQNLNGGLGSLAEVESLSQIVTSPYTLMAGLGVNGTAGVKSSQSPAAIWPQVMTGEGGPVAIDPVHAQNWYVNTQAGVAISGCSNVLLCTPADFGSSPVVSNSDVSEDGLTMLEPAPFIVDPLDSSQLLVATCRVWRGPADGSPWTGANAISDFLDGISGSRFCNGNAQIRTLAALALQDGSEKIYAGMYGTLDGGATLAGHVFVTTFDPAVGSIPVWRDISFSPIRNDVLSFNAYGFDISSIFVDAHDPTGNTVYVTIGASAAARTAVPNVYRSVDGGATWSNITSILPRSPANSIVVDPQDRGTVYLALDAGVYSTRQVDSCETSVGSCWTLFGSGLPESPVTQLSASPIAVSPSVLVAGTFGRGVWQIPLWTAGVQLTSASLEPISLTFPSQPVSTTSPVQTVTLTNMGGLPLSIAQVSVSGDFTNSDHCTGLTLNAGESCTVDVAFAPTLPGLRTGEVAVSANVPGGQLSVALTGTGQAAWGLSVTPTQLAFTSNAAGTPSMAQTITISNTGYVSADDLALDVSGPFSVLQTTCGSSLPAKQQCTAAILFTPAALGKFSGTLTVSSATFASSKVTMSGLAGSIGALTVNPTSFEFGTIGVGGSSPSQTATLSNAGAVSLDDLSLTVPSGFKQTRTTCTGSIAVGSSCTVQIAFAPAQAGTQTGSLTISSSALASDVQVPLSGTGFDFTVGFTGASSQSVASGQTAIYTLALGSLGGATGSITLTCGSLPTNAICTFNPSTVNVTSAVGGSAAVQIATGRAVSALHPGASPSSKKAFDIFLCLLVIAPLARSRKRAKYFGLLVFGIAVGITSCAGSGGGGSTGGGGGSTTPAGTYSIPVNASSNGVTHTVTLTLVVD